MVATDLCVLAGEITTTAKVDYEKIARETIARIGYRSPDFGFSSDSCKVLLNYGQQSPDIAQGVNEGEGLDLEQGAGDQGLMFGYACDETPVLMPFAIYYSHRLMQRQSELRRNGSLPWLRPDAKAQITAVYDSETGKVKRIDTVVLSTQHDEGISYDELREAVIEQIIKPVLPSEMLTEETKYLVNPTGKFIIGGPHGDCGLTGRKIIVDTYGGAAPHGGGAFSGKDPSKSGPFRCLRLPLCCEKHRSCRLGNPMPDSGFLRHRRCRADFDFHRHFRHRQNQRRKTDCLSSRNISTCAPKASSKCSTFCARFTANPPHTAISAAKSLNLLGSALTKLPH